MSLMSLFSFFPFCVTTDQSCVYKCLSSVCVGLSYFISLGLFRILKVHCQIRVFALRCGADTCTCAHTYAHTHTLTVLHTICATLTSLAPEDVLTTGNLKVALLITFKNFPYQPQDVLPTAEIAKLELQWATSVYTFFYIQKSIVFQLFLTLTL